MVITRLSIHHRVHVVQCVWHPVRERAWWMFHALPAAAGSGRSCVCYFSNPFRAVNRDKASTRRSSSMSSSSSLLLTSIRTVCVAVRACAWCRVRGNKLAESVGSARVCHVCRAMSGGQMITRYRSRSRNQKICRAPGALQTARALTIQLVHRWWR